MSQPNQNSQSKPEQQQLVPRQTRKIARTTNRAANIHEDTTDEYDVKFVLYRSTYLVLGCKSKN